MIIENCNVQLEEGEARNEESNGSIEETEFSKDETKITIEGAESSLEDPRKSEVVTRGKETGKALEKFRSKIQGSSEKEAQPSRIDSEKDIGKQWEPKTVNIQMVSGKTLQIYPNILNIHNIGGVKRHIQQERNIPISSQRLFFNKKELKDSDGIPKSYSEDGEITITLAIDKSPPFIVFVYGYRFIRLEVSNSDIVRDLKIKFEKIFGIPSTCQEIESTSPDIARLEDDKPLFVYKLNGETKLVVRKTITVQVQNGGKTGEYQVKVYDKNETVKDLFKKVSNMYSVRMRFPSLKYDLKDNKAIPKDTLLLDLRNVKLHLMP